MARKRQALKFVVSTHQEGTTASYPAMPLTQNDMTFYLVTIPVEDIFPFCFVSRRVENSLDGFQRALDLNRAVDIARYLDNSSGSIPTNMVLSAQAEAAVDYNSKTKTLKFKRYGNSFLVIDGQHRLFGYGLTKKKHRVPVAIYSGLSRSEEASLFIDVNTNQRGVPAALLLDIKQVAEREDASETTLRVFFDKFSEDSDSPFCGYMSPTESKAGRISRVLFNKAFMPLLSNNVIQKLPEEKQYLLLKNYFKSIENFMSQPNLLYKTAYFEAICELFDDVLKISYSKYHNYKIESLTKVIEPIKSVDLSFITSSGKTRITKLTVLPVLKNAISSQIEVYEDMI